MRIINIFSLIFFLIFLIFLFLLNGFETKVLNTAIKQKIETKINGVAINFKDINVSLNLKSLGINLQFNKPEIQFNKKKIEIIKIAADIDLISIITRQYLIRSINLDVEETLVSNISPLIAQLNPQINEVAKKFLDGLVSGSININFENLKDTKVQGVLKNGTIQLLNNFPYASSINSNFDYQDSILRLSVKQGKLADLNIKDTSVILNLGSKDELSLKTKIYIDGEINYLTKLKEFKNLSSSFLPKGIDNLKGNLKIDIALDLLLNNDLSIKKIKSNSEINTIENSFEYFLNTSKDKDKEKFIITKFNSTSNLVDKNFISKGSFVVNNKPIEYSFSKNLDSNYFMSSFVGTINSNEIEALQKIKTLTGIIDFKVNVNNKKGYNNFDINLNLEKSSIYLQNINYKKEKGSSGQLNLIIENIKDKFIISNVFYKSSDSEIKLDSLELNQDYKIENFKEIKVNTPKNSFNLIKSKNLVNLNGSSIDLTEFIKSLSDNKKSTKITSNFFNAEINAKIKKVYLGNDELKDFVLSGKIIKSEYENLNAFGSFSNNETASFQIFRNQKNNLETKLISERSIPFLLGLNFAKGFTNGKLVFESEQFNLGHSISKVTLSNYYVKEMPVLAELLSLTSFTGIIDILSGKGVLFKKSYLEFEKKDGILNIKDAYGTGDSLGYTLEGQINEDGFVSISGNLVPAYLVNDIIRQIPLVGKVITGKQGDGIFGASFKIKGQPNALKTTVNPIRTLTPRFVQRFFDLFKRDVK